MDQHETQDTRAPRSFSRLRLLVALALWLLLAVVVFANSWGTFNTDIKPELYIEPWRMFGRYLSSWTSTPYLGSPNFNVGLAPVLVILSGLRWIGLSPELTFKVFHLVMWTIAAWGVIRLSRRIAPEIGSWGALVAAVVYLANPYTISAGSTLAIALPLALLPWLVLCFVRGLREPRSWVWPALFGLLFFAMTGMNVAVVPLLQLVVLIPVIIALRLDEGIAWRTVASVLARSALFVLGLSLYWLVPALAATATGSQIVAGSETLEGIAKVSSFTEVLRGVGLWPLYGSGDAGPWVPQHAPYVSAPFIMVLTMAWPAIGLLAMRWARGTTRIVVALSTFAAAVIMVGLFHDPQRPASPFGWVLNAAFDLPLVVMFRTTNKVGAVLALALAIGCAVFAVKVLPKLWRFVPMRTSLVVLIVTIMVGWTMPAITGRLYISPMTIPDYWKSAGADLDWVGNAGSVLVLPGQVRPHYRWTLERPDDVLNSVAARTAVLPETTPNSSPVAVNFLSALDGTFQSNTGPANTISTMARYLGATQVLLRNDIVWEDNGGTRPAALSQILSKDPGLFGAKNYGPEGQFTMAPDGSQYEAFLPPLQMYDVWEGRNSIRATPLNGQIVVAGDGFAFPALAARGLLAATPLISYAPDLSASEFATTLVRAGRFVITDTNARRNVIDNRLTAGQGALLTAGTPLDVTRTLGTDTDDQTVKVNHGMTVSTSQSGKVFFDQPFATGDFAFDGDPNTAWHFGDFRTAPGQWLSAKFDKPVKLGKVPISQVDIGKVKIDKITVTAAGKSITQHLRKGDATVFDFKGLEANSILVTVDSIKGKGINGVAISEIGVKGLKSQPFARTPTTFTNLYKELDSSGKHAFARTPLDILLTRVQNTPDIFDDSESRLDRIVSIPDKRTYDVTAQVRVTGSVEALNDALAGFDPTIRATSSRTYFDVAASRASAALDADPTTAWRPGGTTRGAWWQVETAPREISSISITQDPADPSDRSAGQRVTRVRVSIDDKKVATAKIGFGTTEITLPEPVVGSKVRVTLEGVEGDQAGAPPFFSTIDTGLTPAPPNKDAESCLTVATIDGKKLQLKPTTVELSGIENQGTTWVSCAKTKLSAGSHEIEQADGFILDTLSFADRQSGTPTPSAKPRVEVDKDGDTLKRVHVSGATSPYAVAISQGANPRWHAYVDGKDLGPATTVDGFSSGWIIDQLGDVDIEIRYVPQIFSWVAMAVTAVFGVLVLTILVFAGISRRRRRKQPDLMAASAPETGSVALEVGPVTASTPRVILEAMLVLSAGFFVGWGGLAAALLIVAVQRIKAQPAHRFIYLGSLVLMASIAVYLIYLGGDIGKVSSDNVGRSIVPHYVAGAGLVLATAGALMAERVRRLRGTDD